MMMIQLNNQLLNERSMIDVAHPRRPFALCIFHMFTSLPSGKREAANKYEQARNKPYAIATTKMTHASTHFVASSR